MKHYETLTSSAHLAVINIVDINTAVILKNTALLVCKEFQI